MPKAKKKKDGLWNYKPPAELDGVGRVVDFLLWAANRFPRRPVPITHIVRIALGEKNLPKEESKDVIAFRQNKMQRVRKTMMAEHQCGVIYHPGMGYRASVDSEDVVENVMEKSRVRVQGAIAGMSKAQALVDPKKLHTPHIKERFGDLAEANKRLNAPGIQKRLTPPDPEDEK